MECAARATCSLGTQTCADWRLRVDGFSVRSRGTVARSGSPGPTEWQTSGAGSRLPPAIVLVFVATPPALQGCGLPAGAGQPEGTDSRVAPGCVAPAKRPRRLRLGCPPLRPALA